MSQWKGKTPSAIKSFNVIFSQLKTDDLASLMKNQNAQGKKIHCFREHGHKVHLFYLEFLHICEIINSLVFYSLNQIKDPYKILKKCNLCYFPGPLQFAEVTMWRVAWCEGLSSVKEEDDFFVVPYEL